MTKLRLEGLVLFEPALFTDYRGAFFESFNQSVFESEIGASYKFVQDNHSISARGVLRGLHFQRQPKAQGKLVRVLAGEVFDVAVDIRPSLPTFGQWEAVVLSAENRRQLWIPPGFAHGFLALTEGVELLYKVTDYYSPADEGCIIWNDPAIAIEWPETGEIILSEKDKLGRHLADCVLA